MTTTSRYYCGNFEYDGNKALSLIHTDEGIVEVTRSGSTTNYNYEYFLKDHLDNTRMLCSSTGALLQRSDFYPFGMTSSQYNNSTDNKYLYNGKELQEDISLNWYDYGARFYDPQIGRWTSIDPAIELHHNYTPYAYVYNNPLIFIDPIGLDSSFYKANGDLICKEQGDKGKTDNNFVIKTTETTDEMYGEDSYRGKGKTNPITEEEAENTANEINDGDLTGDHMKNLVKLRSSKVMRKMINSIKDDGNGGESHENNREYGGNFSNNGVKDLAQGPIGDPSNGQPASISSTNGLKFHSHPSGSKHFVLNGQRKLAQWRQPPSRKDINTANGREYVIGMNSRIIYIYNRTGVIATIPINIFKK